MQSQSFQRSYRSYTYIHTSSCLLENEDDRHTCMQTPILTLDLACTHTQARTYISGALLVNTPRSAFITYTHSHLGLIACTSTHIPRGAFLFHTYRSVSLTYMQCYTQLAYLFHQCGTSLSRDGCIADCTVRHSGVECLFSCTKIVIKSRIFSRFRGCAYLVLFYIVYIVALFAMRYC